MFKGRIRHVWVVAVLVTLAACTSSRKRLDTIESLNPADLTRLCGQQITGACALLGQDVPASKPLPVLQGVTTDSHTRLVVQIEGRKPYGYFLLSNGQAKKLNAEIINGPESKWAIAQLELFDLSNKETYEFLILSGDGELLDRRKFSALDTRKKNPRIAVASCMDDDFDDQTKIWRALIEQKPDVVLMIGDNVYADRNGGARRGADAAQLWRRYTETRSKLEFFKANPLIPVFAVWDDHDFGKNDGDRTYPYKFASAETFFAFFPQRKPAPGFERGPGVSSWWRAFGVQFALLDNRSFRSPNNLDIPDQSHFGPDQEKWISEGLAGAKEPVFLISGDQFFGGYHKFESYEGNHPKNFKAQMQRWRRASSRPVVFMSGDRHLTEIIKVSREHLGYPTYELTSSGIHARMYPGSFERDPSPNQLVGDDGDWNFMVIDLLNAKANSLEFKVRSLGLGNQVLFQKTLQVKR